MQNSKQSVGKLSQVKLKNRLFRDFFEKKSIMLSSAHPISVISFGYQLVLATKNTEINFPEFKNMQGSCKILNPD